MHRELRLQQEYVRQFVMLAAARDTHLAIIEIFALRPADHDLGRDIALVAKHRLNRNVQIWKGIDEAGPNGAAQLADFPCAIAPHWHVAQLSVFITRG